MSFKGSKLSEEHKQKLSIAHCGTKLSEETKNKISQSCKGKQPTKEAIRKSSESRTGQKRSQETCEKIRQAKLGKKLSKETKNKISQSLKGSCNRSGKIPWNKGKSWSKEVKNKISKSWVSSGRHGSGKGGYHNGIQYQSSYELHFMQFLDEYKIPYERANQFKVKYIFENQEHYYYPDFYLPREGSIIEVKALWKLKELKTKAKLKAAKEKYGEQFLILTEQELPELVTGVSNEINKIRSSKFIGSQRI